MYPLNRHSDRSRGISLVNRHSDRSGGICIAKSLLPFKRFLHFGRNDATTLVIGRDEAIRLDAYFI
jgi:hypothetical protein